MNALQRRPAHPARDRPLTEGSTDLAARRSGATVPPSGRRRTDLSRAPDRRRSSSVRVASRRVITELDALVDPLSSSSERPILLRPGAIREELVQFEVRDVGVTVVDFSCAITMHGTAGAGRVNCLTALNNTAWGRVNGQAVTPGFLCVYGESTEVTATSAEGSRYALFSLRSDALQGAASVLGVQLEMPADGELRMVRAENWRQIDGYLRLVHAAVPSATAPVSVPEWSTARNALLVAFARALARGSATAVGQPSSHFNPMRIVHACEATAAEARYQDVTIADLAAASRVSERSVRNAFAKTYGMSPTAYLRVVALGEVRRALSVAPPSTDAVTRAASDYGFWHLGRFASYYRTLFGESPSATFAQTVRAEAS